MNNIDTRYAEIFEILMSPLVKSIQPVHRQYHKEPVRSFLKITLNSDDRIDRDALMYKLEQNTGGDTLFREVQPNSFWFRLVEEDDKEIVDDFERRKRIDRLIKVEHYAAMFFQALLTKNGISSYKTSLEHAIQTAEYFLDHIESNKAD